MKTAQLPKDWKTCETCKYYDPEGKLNMGICTYSDWPIPVEAHEVCDNWAGDDEEDDKKEVNFESINQSKS